MKKSVDRMELCCYNIRAVRNAAIAQQVERILGKDEVSSSNLDISSKIRHLAKDVDFVL